MKKVVKKVSVAVVVLVLAVVKAVAVKVAVLVVVKVVATVKVAATVQVLLDRVLQELSLIHISMCISDSLCPSHTCL